MEDDLILNGVKYISSKRASGLTGYSKDYVGQMCRSGKIDAKLVGRNWYVNEYSILEHQEKNKGNYAVDNKDDDNKEETQDNLLNSVKIKYHSEIPIYNTEIDEVPLNPELVKKPASHDDNKEINTPRRVTVVTAYENQNDIETTHTNVSRDIRQEPQEHINGTHIHSKTSIKGHRNKKAKSRTATRIPKLIIAVLFIGIILSGFLVEREITYIQGKELSNSFSIRAPGSFAALTYLGLRE